jgi:hypothetical protein
MLTTADLAPVIVAGIAATVVLFLVWLSLRQAHSGERKARKAARDAERSGPAA